MPPDARELIQPLPALQQRAEHSFAQIEPPVPEAVLLCFAHPFLAEGKRLTSAQATGSHAGEQELFRGVWNRTTVGVVGTGVGSPATAMVAEKVVAAGAKVLIGVGFCGGLRVGSGATVLPTDVVGEAGVLQAYGVKQPEGDPGLLDGLAASADAEGLTVHEGRHWTTDAIYRETEGKVRHYRDMGCLGVDMETAGLYATAHRRGVRAAALLVVTDTLDKKWKPLRRLPRADVDRAVRAALAALCP